MQAWPKRFSGGMDVLPAAAALAEWAGYSWPAFDAIAAEAAAAAAAAGQSDDDSDTLDRYDMDDDVDQGRAGEGTGDEEEEEEDDEAEEGERTQARRAAAARRATAGAAAAAQGQADPAASGPPNSTDNLPCKAQIAALLRMGVQQMYTVSQAEIMHDNPFIIKPYHLRATFAKLLKLAPLAPDCLPDLVRSVLACKIASSVGLCDVSGGARLANKATLLVAACMSCGLGQGVVEAWEEVMKWVVRSPAMVQEDKPPGYLHTYEDLKPTKGLEGALTFLACLHGELAKQAGGGPAGVAAAGGVTGAAAAAGISDSQQAARGGKRKAGAAAGAGTSAAAAGAGTSAAAAAAAAAGPSGAAARARAGAGGRAAAEAQGEAAEAASQEEHRHILGRLCTALADALVRWQDKDVYDRVLEEATDKVPREYDIPSNWFSMNPATEQRVQREQELVAKAAKKAVDEAHQQLLVKLVNTLTPMGPEAQAQLGRILTHFCTSMRTHCFDVVRVLGRAAMEATATVDPGYRHGPGGLRTLVTCTLLVS